MKNRISKVISFFLVLSVFVSANTLSLQAASQSGKTIKKEIQFSSDRPEEIEATKFEETISENGKTYRLKDIQQEIVDKTPVKAEKEVEKTVDSEAITQGETFNPKETITEEDVTYTLDRIEEKERKTTGGQTQKVTGYTDYDHAVGKTDVPSTKKVTVKDNQTGENKTVTCSLTDVTPLSNQAWEDTHIDITFISYDSNIFRWNDVTVNKSDSAPLSGYETQLLQSVGADTSNYRVNRTYWVGEAYTNRDGVLCRNARADVQRKVQYYRANYVGEIKHPEEVSTVYTAFYKGTQFTESTEDYVYVIKATATYEQEDNNTMKYVVATVGTLLFLALVVWILFILRKRRNKEKEERKI